MCGQFEALLKFRQIVEALRLETTDEGALSAAQVIKPTLAAPIVIANPDHGGFEIAHMRFGLVPHWYRGAFRDFKATTFNARLEDIGEKPVFKGAYKYRHAIVPAEAFYEWSGPKAERTQWRVTRADNQPLAFAGIWDQADCQGGEMFSFAILTRAAGSNMAAIHTREPVLLDPDQWDDWLRLKPVDMATPKPLRLQALTPDRPQANLDLF